MNTSRSLAISLLLLIIITVTGTIGYMVVEGWNFLDSLYMTVITLATVGYGEVHEMSRIGRVYTILLMLVGVGLCVYVAGAAVQFMVEGQIRSILGRRKLSKKLDRLKNHYIVCGYGRIGRVLCRKLMAKPMDLVVIEKNRDLVPSMDEDGILYICGDAAEDENLIDAGIRRAKGLVAVLGTDTENVFIVLSGRQLNPDIYIIARASMEKAKTKLRAAGADKVESPYEMGAASMALRILRPTVTSFLDLAFARKRKDIEMEEIPVSPHSVLAGLMLKDSGIRQKFNLIIIAIKQPDDTMLFNPSFKSVVKGGDTLIAVGEEANLSKLAELLNPLP